MATDYSKIRGTVDLFGEDLNYHNHVSDTLKIISELYGFNEMITPIFEGKDLFAHNIGDTTDIVNKEFYDFVDKGGRNVVLRPEGTLSVVRSIIENKLIYSEPLPLKYFYFGPMFRYERPQSGRQRQFHQYGIEYIGVTNTYQQVEVILLALNVLNSFKVKNFTLKINYIGGIETRAKWLDELKKYFKKFKGELTADSQKRLDKNPLRILDDKEDSKKDFVINAPKVDLFLNDSEKNEKQELLDLLSKFKIDFDFDPTMVRGLDYYSGFVFEFVSKADELKSQSTIIGGGKYENIFTKFGHENKTCIGFAIGIERLIKAMKAENPINFKSKLQVYFANLIEDKTTALLLISMLRSAGVSVESNLNLTKLDKHFKYATVKQPKVIVILGQKELEQKKIIIKYQESKKEKSIKIESLLKEILKEMGKK